MKFDLTFVLIVAATFADGILTGASLDQSIKQLPARHKIGVVAFSVYSRASDLGHGIVWYAILGVGAALLTIVAAVLTFLQGVALTHALAVYIAAVLSLLHSLATTKAAPTNFSQRQVISNEAALTAVFDRFAQWQTLRAILQVLTFGAILWGLVMYVS